MIDAILAASPSGTAPTDIASYVLYYGPVGLLLFDVCVTRRLFVPRWTLDREEKERERDRVDMQARIDAQSQIIGELTDHFVKDVVPALTLATEVNRQYVNQLQADRHDR